MKDEFFALTLTGIGCLFGAGMMFTAGLGSLLHDSPEAAVVMWLLMFLMFSAARNDARTQIKDGTYRGRLLHVRDGSPGFTFTPPKPDHDEQTAQTLS